MISASNSTSSELLDLPGKKRVRKFYGIKGENWNLAVTVDSKTLERSEENYRKFAIEDDLGTLKILLGEAREFLQVKFRSLDVSEHVFELPDFWKLPHGTQLLSSWFEWLVGGSKDGWLQASIETNLETILLIVKDIIVDKKGEQWLAHMDEVTHDCEERNGNQIMVWITLIREWAVLYQDKPSKVILSMESTATVTPPTFLTFMSAELTSQGEMLQRSS